MSQIVIEPSLAEGQVEAQPSKSYTHRFLAIALLADGKSKISNPLLSLDTQSTLRAVKSLGGRVKERGGNLEISGTGGELSPTNRAIDVGNSGTTLRLMTAVASLLPKKIRLTGDKSILKRPMGPLIKSLSNLGAEASCEGKNDRPPVVVGGGLEGGETRITGAVSSQFISALLIASPYSRVGVDLEVEEELKSKPYVRMTLETLKYAGANIESDRSLMSYSIPGGQVFEPLDREVPGDFSSAAFMLGAGVLGDGAVEVRNLDPEDVQGDRKILELLREFGGKVEIENETVRAEGGERLQGIDVDCSNIPDLVPVLAVLGSVAEGQTRLHNISHLRYKEVDRLNALAMELKKLGVRIKELEEGLKIFGSRKLEGGKLDSHGDHRMAMALAIAGLAAEKPVTISKTESIEVSYPNFVQDLKNLGVKAEIRK